MTTLKRARIELDPSLRDRLLNDSNLPTQLDIRGRAYAIVNSVGAGFKGVVWKATDEFGRWRAIKLAAAGDYADRSYLQEVSRSAKLDPYRQHFAQLEDAGVVVIQIDGAAQTMIAFVEEWVDGFTLRTFLEKHPDQVSVGFLLSFIRTLCSSLNALKIVGLKHDDLHAGNIMVARPPSGILDQEWTFRTIDMGSLKPSNEAAGKTRDDHGNFVAMVVSIWNTIKRRGSLSVRDRRFLANTRPLFDAMLDSDGARALRDPAQISEQFNLAIARAESQITDTNVRLLSPFEYISAEHISDDRLFLRIFAKSCPWLEKVSGPDPCLVSGPRGCGKSTIFRWLSLRAHLHKEPEELAILPVWGFYISCSTDMQNRLGWITTEALARRFQREIVHYFSLLIAREVAHTFQNVAKGKHRAFWGFSNAQETNLYAFMNGALRSNSRPRLQGVPPMAQVLDTVEGEILTTHAAMLQGTNLSHTLPETFVGDLTNLLAREMAVFRSKKIAFLVDDFSTHRIAECVQLVLNRVIWERRGTHVFKLSSEKRGAILQDPADAGAELARELVEIDCGREFVALDDADKVTKSAEFAAELLNHRLKEAKYRGTAEKLLGHSAKESLAKELARPGPRRQSASYSGLERLSSLCSGDVSHLLLVFRRIFEEANLNTESETTVSPEVQDRCVRQVSRDLLEAVRSYFPNGPEMYSVVNAFGNLVRKILYEGRKHNGEVPVQAPRIEIDQEGGGPADKLTEQQQSVAAELIRRSIFIDMGPGLSRHRYVTTLRWHLRRIYLPTFGAALAKNDAVKKKPDWLKFLLSDPKSACEMVWDAWPKGPEAAQPLFEDSVTVDANS